jgi:RNA ligase
MKYDLEILNKYIEDGLLECQSHPTLPLKIYNYSRDCQFEKKWDDITLAMRGTVLDNEGNLVAKSFNKFFNLYELQDIPNEEFDVYEKLDGSILIFFNYKGEWIFASKGSFTSEQAIKGLEMFNDKYGHVKLYDSITYVFEILYIENRIVCHYSEEDVVLTGAFSGLTELSLEHYFFDGLTRVKKYYGLTDIDKMKSIIGDNREGFVIKFRPSGLRVKIKSDEYVRLHRLLTNFSNVDIWECLRNKTNFNDFLDRTPDEFDGWVRGVKDGLVNEYHKIEETVHLLLEDFKDKRPNFPFDGVGKKEFAMWVKEQPRVYQPILFSLYNGKDYSDTIWRILRPTYQKPFWNKEVE